MPKNVISFSVFGDNPKYVQGAMANIGLAHTIYPGWVVRFYVEENTPAVKYLKNQGAEIIQCKFKSIALAKCWRFYAIDDPYVDRVIFRDTDSRLNVREKAAVDAWVSEGKVCHIMHDHPHHACYPIFCGMWGVVGKPIKNVKRIVNTYGWSHPTSDTQFVTDLFWPWVRESVTHHTSVENKWGGVPFPAHPEWRGFVGQQCEADGTQIWP